MPDTSRYLLAPQRITQGNRIELLVNGEQAYPAMRQAIGAAQHTITLETYIFASDETGWGFARLLADRAKAGVEVNVLVDSLGSLGMSSSLAEALERSGVRLVWYRPLAPWRSGWGWWRRDHKKILVVDGQVGFVGGLNLADDYAAEAEGGRGWRDTHARLQGPVVRQLQRAFLATWRKAGGPDLPHARYLIASPEQGDSPAVLLTNGVRGQRRQIRRAYLHVLRRAREYIFLTNAYFVPDIGIRRRLRNACRRGVDVRILLAGASDSMLVNYAERNLYARLLRWGAHLYEWPGPMMHAKTAVVDGVWATVGSCNLDMLSLRYNLESNVVSLGSELAEPLTRVFLEDTRQAREISLTEWCRRPFHQKLLERFAYRLRKWL